MAEPSKRRGPESTQARVQRLLLLLPWLAERGSAPVPEVAARFGVPESVLIKDIELAAMCGVGPSPGDMIWIYLDDENNVNVGSDRLIPPTLRLLRHEAFALVAAAEAASELPGADPEGALGRALEKVRARLGGAVEVADRAPRFAARLQEAVRNREELEIRYWTASRDEVNERCIEPRLLFVRDGDFYVRADDSLSGDERVFRIDRILELNPTGQTFAPRDVRPGADEWFAEQPDAPIARLRLRKAARWVAERYPVRSITELDDGGCEAELVVLSEIWLARVLLRIGTDGEVVAPAHWRDLGRRTAESMVRRYADGH